MDRGRAELGTRLELKHLNAFLKPLQRAHPHEPGDGAVGALNKLKKARKRIVDFIVLSTAIEISTQTARLA